MLRTMKRMLGRWLVPIWLIVLLILTVGAWRFEAYYNEPIRKACRSAAHEQAVKLNPLQSIQADSKMCSDLAPAYSNE